MKKRLLVISVFVLFLSTQTTFLLAQNGCAATLSEAQDSFEAGHLYAIPATLTKYRCCFSPFSLLKCTKPIS